MELAYCALVVKATGNPARDCPGGHGHPWPQRSKAGFSFSRRNSCAFRATTIVEADIRTAPETGESTTPAKGEHAGFLYRVCLMLVLVVHADLRSIRRARAGQASGRARRPAWRTTC
jgi:hypothetical protein